MRSKWRRILYGPKLMMAEGTQKARHKEKCTAKINESPDVGLREARPFALDGMARSATTGDSCRGSLTNRGHVEAKRESIQCSRSSTERPLLLSLTEGCDPSGRLSCLAAQNSSIGKRMGFSSAVERAGKMTIFRGRFASDHVANGSLAERFVSWRDSATGAVENIRRRLSVFRRTRSLDVDTDEGSFGDEHAAPSKLKPKNAAGGKEQSDSENASFDKVADVFLPNDKDPDTSALLGKPEDVDGQTVPGKANPKLAVSELSCDKKIGIEAHACDSINDGTYSCATCMLGSKDSLSSISAPLNDPETQYTPPKSAENECDIYSPSVSRVVNKQPVTGPSLGKTPNPEVRVESTSADETKPATSNPDTNAIGMEKPPKTLTMAQGSQEEEDQVSMENKGVPRKCPSGVNLWDLRNSLEQTTIELKYINFAEEREGQALEPKQSGLDVTEASPRSTPSSEFFISRDKSVTDSDDCGRYLYLIGYPYST